jgi:hypothetical protein
MIWKINVNGFGNNGQLGTWEPSQHLLKDTGKPRKFVSIWPVTGPSGCVLNSDQQSGNERHLNI